MDGMSGKIAVVRYGIMRWNTTVYFYDTAISTHSVHSTHTQSKYLHTLHKNLKGFLCNKFRTISMDGHTMQTAPALVPLAEVKLHLARLVVRWVTTCEVRVLSVFVLARNFVATKYTHFYDFCTLKPMLLE